MQRFRSNIGTTLRVASLAVALGLLASPAAAQAYGDWYETSSGHSANGTGGGAGGESGSGSVTETVMPDQRNTSGSFVTGRTYRDNEGRHEGNTGRAYRGGYNDGDAWSGGYTR
jgi:hypothetical protein